MKQSYLSLLILFLFLPLIFIACNKEDVESTGQNGRPSMIKQIDQTKTSFYYTGNKISKIKEKKGSVYTFTYVGDELISINTSPEDSRVADGTGSTTFTREGNKIIIKDSGDPFGDIISIKELELDVNNIPVKLTDLGFFRLSAEGLNKESDGSYYTLFTFNPLTGSLWKQKTYDIITDEIITSCSYEYDEAHGMISRVDMPLWFYAYWLHIGNYVYWSPLKALFHNYANNLHMVKIVHNKESFKELTVDYQYQYNQYEYPFFMENNYLNTNMFTISY